MKKNNKKFRLPLRAWLMYIILVAFLSTGVTLSKYVTSSKGGDMARIIKFSDIVITETGNFCENGKFRVQPGVSIEKKPQVTFGGSESAVYIFLTAESDFFIKNQDNYSFSALDDKLNWSVDSEKWTFLLSENGTHIYFKALEANQELNDTIIKNNTITVSDTLLNSEIADLSDFSLNFRSIAVQANGFVNAEDAWNAVKNK